MRVAVLPTERGAELVRCFGCGFRAGDCYASGWLERSNPPGPWLQTGRSAAMFRCRRELLATGAGAAIEPLGYVDHGRADVMAIRPGR